MTQEEKYLLLIDLCERLPYLPIVEISIYRDDNRRSNIELDPHISENIWELIDKYHALPYLRPMSSMTEEERNEYFDFRNQELQRVALAEVGRESAIAEISDWLNAHHFDYRRLIERGLAIEVTEENNPYKE